jgi:Tfp pilus assembly protein PilX
MTILIMALLALLVLGLIGILLSQTVIMEHSANSARIAAPQPAADSAHLDLKFETSRKPATSADQSPKETVNEHVLVG